MHNHTIIREFPLAFERVFMKLPFELEKRSFTILSSDRIDTLFQKHLGVSFTKYALFCVCNLPLMYHALQHNVHCGILSAFNIIVCESTTGTVTGTIKLSGFSSNIDDEYLKGGAVILERKLNDVLDSVGGHKPEKQIIYL